MPDAAPAHEGADPPLASRQRKKKTLLLGGVAGLLVVGAVLAGVFGSRAAANKKRRPIPIESVTYTMVTEGLRPATVVPLSLAPLQQQNATPSTSTLAGSSSSGTAPTTATSKPTSLFDSLKNLVGAGSSTPATPKFDPTAMVLPPGAVAVPSWKAMSDATTAAHVGAAVANGQVVCYARTGQELIEQVSREYNSPCQVVVLTNDKFTPYSIDKTLNISRPIMLLGRPINPPMLNSTNRIVRLMDIQPGGRLEARAVQFVRGFGYYVAGFTDHEMNVVAGSIMRVHVGAFFTGVGCMFRERNNTRHTFEEEVRTAIANPATRSRQFGQMILVLGGTLHLNGCRSMRFRPFGNGILNAMVIGRDINVVAGFATLVAHYTYAGNLFSVNLFISGAIALVMGGVLTMVGGNTINSNLMQVQVGLVCQIGAYAGTFASIGWAYTSCNGLLFRQNGGQFGVVLGFSYMTGFVQGRAWGLGTVFGPGQTYIAVQGLYHWHGGATCSYAICQAFFGAGGSTYIGSGQLVHTGIPSVRTVVTQSNSMAGGTTFLGAGSLTQTLSPAMGVQMVRINMGVATDVFLGGGWANNINITRFSFQLVNCFFGFGNQFFVGLGGAVFIRSYSYSNRKVNFARPTIFTYTVAGTGTSSSGTKGQNLVMTKGGVTRYVFNKTTKSVTQISAAKRQRTASPTAVGRRTRRKAGAVGTRRKVQASDVADMDTTLGSWLTNIVDSTGGLDPSIENKVVVLQTTIMEGRKNSWTPPHPDLFKAPELKARWGGYAKILADGLVDDDEQRRKLALNAAKDDGSAGFHPGLISANNSDCFLCSVGPGKSEDHIGGPGSCEVSEECKADNPVDAYEEATKLTTKNILPPAADAMLPKTDGDGNYVYPNTWLLWSELVVYCRSTDPDTDDASITDDCLDKEYLKEVLKGYILLNSTTDEYHITVAPSGLHRAAQQPNFAPDAQDTSVPALKEAMVPAWNPDCQGWTKYDIQVVASEAAAEQHILDVFEEFFADAADLEDTILSNWDQHQEEDLQPCGIIITEKGEQRYPSIKAMPAFRPSTTSLLAPNVVVADGTSIEPLRKLVPGEAYKIYVQNFPAGSKVVVRLLQGLQLNGPTVATIAKFEDDGTVEVAWTAPTDVDLDGGKYYLQAQPADFPALFAFSQVFSFKDVSKPEAFNPWMFNRKNF